MGKLTEAKIRKLKTDNNYSLIVNDGNHLYLAVRRSGRKTWLLRGSEHSSFGFRTVGVYPAMTLAQARQLAFPNRSGGRSLPAAPKLMRRNGTTQ